VIRSRRSLAALLLLLLGAYALRLYRLDAQSLWWDEGISLHLATSSAADIVRDRLNNIHPPLYFFLLKGWLALVGVSPFTGRYLSVVAGLLQVALVFAAAGFVVERFRARTGEKSALKRWTTNGGAAWLAAGLMLLSPLSVIYSQEIRVYALLPVVYLALLLLAGRWLTATHHSPPATRSPASLPLLALTAWFALHLHYIALFGVAAVGGWGVFVLWRRRDWAGLRRWLLAFALVGAASLPWLLAVAANWPAVQAEAAAGTFATEPVPLPFLFAQVWVFHLTGLAGALSSPFVRLGAAVAAVLAGGLLAAAIGDTLARRQPAGSSPAAARLLLRLAAFWALPLLGGLLVWSVRSFSHPRYITMFAALLVPLVALLMAAARTPLRRCAAALLGLCLVALSLWGLRHYFFDPATAKPDVRGAARFLEATAAPDDLILVPDTDWSLPFEYRGATPVLMPAVAQSPHDPDAVLTAALDCTAGRPCAQSGRVFVLDYRRGTRDWQSRLPFELARRGHWAATTDFGDVVVNEYRLGDSAGPLPACDTPDVGRPAARFGPLALTGAWLGQGAASDTAVAVALCWRLDDTATDVSASLVLRDPLTGEIVAQQDTPLLDGDGAPAGRWQPGDEVITYHVLPLSPGTPPLAFALALGVYEGGAADVQLLEARDAAGAPLGRLLPLGDVALAPPVGLRASLYGVEGSPLLSRPTAAVGGLRLLGFSAPPGPFRPGQTIRVRLTWQGASGLGDVRPSLALEVGGAPVAENADAPAQGRYPTDRWAAGERVTEVRDVRVPAEAVGAAELVVRVNGERLAAIPVEIGGATAEFAPPTAAVAADATFGDVIRLVGFDPPPETVDPAQPVPITLYWQALAGDISTGYTVFVHLLADDGRLIAQSDAVPAGGARPTNEWLAGEYVSDRHQLAWRETGYSGPVRLAVGLYDPLTGARLPTADGDLFVLPTTLTVAP
jgi:4-amino-4-deoxy-L-arabinose transferase-like glycosyltransferase